MSITRASKTHSQLIRHGTYLLSDVLPHIGKSTHDFQGKKIRMRSDKYRVFREHGTVCKGCGMQGRFFALENLPGISKYHFNLYGIDREGDEVLMTVDHIVPRAHGGASSLENYQTFCKVCNERKGDRIPNEPVMNRFFYPSADELHVIKASLKNRGYSRELQSLEARDIGLGYAYRDGRTKAFIVIENTLFEGVGRNKLSAVSESFTRPPYTF